MMAWKRAGRTRRERELDEEIQSHFEMAVRDRVARGDPRDAAELAVRREFGNRTLVQEVTRDMWGWRWLERLRQDAGYGVRMMRRNPGFTAIAVLSLALAIGANTAIFSLIDTLMFRELPVREPRQLVQVLSSYPGEPRILGTAWRYYEHYRDQNHVFSDLIGISPARFRFGGSTSERETIDGAYVSGNFFPALGVAPAIGRFIGPADDRPGAPAVAVVSWTYWKTAANLNPAILGTSLVLEGTPAMVIGVAPPDFFGLQIGMRQDVYLPVGVVPPTRQPGVSIMGRLKPGVSVEQARADLRVLDRWRIEDVISKNHDPLWRQVLIDVEPAAAGFSVLRDRFAGPLLMLMIVVSLLLLIACTNVANMLLARGAARAREMAVRVALGAGRLRLLGQVLTESLLLCALAGALGVVLAYGGANALVRIIASGQAFVGWPGPVEIDVRPDGRVLLFTAAVALSAGVLFGLAPGWSAFASTPSSSLRQPGAPGETPARRLFGKSLVVAQVALSVVLLSGAGLFVGHLSNLRNVDVGFRRDSLLLVALNPQGSGYNRYQLTRLYRDLLGRLQAIPGVRSASVSGVTPTEGGAASRFAGVEGFEERAEDRRYLMMNWVSPKYFETLGTPLVAGRDFQFEDEGRPPVAIVNRAMAQHYFRDSSAIGKHVTFDGDAMPYEIIGVVGDAKYTELREPAPRTIYMNTFQNGAIFSRFALLTSVPPLSVAPEVRRLVADVTKTVRVAKITTMADQMDATLVPERLIATLSGLFGALGAGLAAIGLYGLLAYTVARRTSEIGIRMALGATRRDVTRMVLKSALALAGAGLAIGTPIAIWSRRFAPLVVEQLRAGTAAPIVMAMGAMIGVAFVAAYIPARRAARVQPMDALRHT